MLHYTQVYLWGGRNDENACNTLFRFDTKNHTWTRPSVTGCIPGARDGHSAVIIRNKMFIFGGYEEEIRLFSQVSFILYTDIYICSLICNVFFFL
jgi:N-acetylneuraminic acid mutarotase